MSFLSSMDASASGLTAQRLRMDIISENIANVTTTRTGDGGPYRRKTVLFQERGEPFASSLERAKSKGVKVTSVTEDRTPGMLVYEPEHPDANADGYVLMPNVNIVREMTDMISASRSYEANVTAMNLTKSMVAKTLEIGR
ncbi:MAG: flagellar basal body rod protein FlgC [Clostridiales bacterium]|jgi:flagellar basal-body rod protein FlgC|nr:flagellar basal body rod protein FlgC [Clostridiales bacterium]